MSTIPALIYRLFADCGNEILILFSLRENFLDWPHLTWRWWRRLIWRRPKNWTSHSVTVLCDPFLLLWLWFGIFGKTHGKQYVFRPRHIVHDIIHISTDFFLGSHDLLKCFQLPALMCIQPYRNWLIVVQRRIVGCGITTAALANYKE